MAGPCRLEARSLRRSRVQPIPLRRTAQAGIFSFFINYIVADTPPISAGTASSWFLGGGNGATFQTANNLYFINEMGATKLLSYAFFLFLAGRFIGAFLMRSFPPI